VLFRSPLASLLAVGALLLLGVAGNAAPRTIGIVADATPASNRIPFVRFVDVLIDALAASRQWEPTVVYAESPLVRVSGATWPQATRDDWMTAAGSLQALLLATELDDLLVVRPIPAVTNDLEIFWLRQGEPDIRRLHLSEAGAGDQAYTALCRRLLAQLEEGTAKAPLAVVARPSVAPSTGPATPVTPTTPPPASPPSAPATSVVPGTGAAVAVGGHETPATAVATAPPVTPGPAAQLPKPGTGEAQPTGPGDKPDAPTGPPAQPGAGPVGPQTPTTAPVTATGAAPAAPPATPDTPTGPVATPPAAATEPARAPKAPSAFLSAAQKYLKDRDFGQVEEMLVKAQAAGDPRGQVFALWAELEKARQNPTAERTWLQRALAEDDSLNSAHLRLAELLRQSGLWRKAAEEYQLVIQREPDNLYPYLGLSALYASQSQPRRAAEVLTQAIEHAPQDASLYLRLGDLHMQRQAWAEAENAYDRAVRLTKGAQRAEALDRLGDLYLAAGREREGFICFVEASKLRVGGSSTMAEKRYQQIMRAADEALVAACARTQTALGNYLSGQGVYREEVWAAFSDLRAQVQDVLRFVNDTVPPATLKAIHLQRKLAYSLAAEAALAGLDYIDQGAARQQRLQDSRRLMDEALATLRAL
jgi:tetratricopeptide (TPR) repeat protein